ncbi:MAG: matrixin family metalloprotease [Planctomycetota bacterium]
MEGQIETGEGGRWSALGRLAPAGLVLGGVCALLAPRSAWAFEVFGDTLDLTQRDYRFFGGFTDAAANSNTVPDPDFPGSLGAELAVRKGVAEWGSRPHGSGLTDPRQDVIGSGGANFDAVFAGRATEGGGPNRNIVSVVPGGAVFAQTELPIADGWRIRFFDNAAVWSDAPGGPGAAGAQGMDIQGVMAHEYGHALGLDHTAVVGATMSMDTADRGVDLRSIEADDIDGVQFLYGVASALKPVVDTYTFTPSGALRLEGAHFHPTDNEVWFTRAAASGPADEPLVRATSVASSAGGTVLELAIPAEAGAGDVAVRVPGSGGDSLSNAHPFDPVRLPWTPPIDYGTPGTSSSGSPVTLRWDSLPSLTAGTVRLLVEGGSGSGPEVGILAVGTARGALPTPFGTLPIGGSLRRVGMIAMFNGVGLAFLDLTDVAPAPGAVTFVTAWVPDGNPSGAVFTNGLEIEAQD